MIRTRFRPIAVAVAAAATVLSLSGTAAASGATAPRVSGGTTTRAATPVPTGKAALTRNPIYKTGQFDFTECKELDRRPDDVDSYKIYLDHLLDCLNLSWAEEFRQAGLSFAKPKVRYITSAVKTGCGKYPAPYAAGIYCQADKTMWILIYKQQLADPSEFELFDVIAHEYGHYVQDRVGILRAMDKLAPHFGTAKFYALNRRVELQAECFSGAFIGSIWHSLGRDQFDWDDLLDYTSGDKFHGKRKNIIYWATRGWNGNGPSVCNTFTAPASKVA
ncbi:neutral zinc metallopeptidase [Planotetraspora sp. A-T 1434]|uniref:neutral zinc metallopeptidase n=1 Tax=Planotetraspora sp. A-T 1434 TaxID=2979219 RepID=UPI0021C0F9CC|nr:neutral zinc metallopeptidase [Planotetraspora sp. A-T 1434]MCT9929487.1 neutral zinc metallopeptidase [Planotetraspora sp. A-T 1434]